MALRQNAISVGAVEYLLKGCGCDPARERAVDLEKALERDPGMRTDHQHEHARGHAENPGREHGRDLGADRYFNRAVDQGEPAGVWLGTGMEALGLAARDGDRAVADEVRAVFGQLRRPGALGARGEADWIGAKPRQYPSREEKLAKLLANEPGGTASAERLVELETQVAASPQRSAVAYYDWTFSPVKSVSVYYAALLAAGDEAGAGQVRGAHEQAVREAMAYAEQHVAWTRNGSHGRNADGDRVGEFVRGIGLSVVAFGHSTSRENEPQLHTHVALLNRIGFLLESGELKIGALDSRGFFAMKQAVEAVYTRSLEDQLTEERGVVFATRPDGKAREIAGIGQDLISEASTRRSQVLERVAELVAAYEARTGHEPAQATRRRLSEMAALETRPAKSEMSGPAGVHAWGAQRVERLVAALERVDDLGLQAALAAAIRDARTDGRGHQPDGRGQEAGHERGHEGGRGLAGLAADLERVAVGPIAGEPVAGQAERVAAAMGPAATLDERVAAAVAAGIADVQAAYPTFVLGTLVAQIDAHLPATAELGIARTERGAYVEGLAARAVAAGGGHEVVQLTGHEPVEVPAGLLRGADGRPRFRPHMDQRYTTARHLEREERIVARFAEPAAPVLDEPGLRAAEARMTRVGLSADQRAAALGALASTRRGSVLIGPAGTGKSRTVMALAHEWAAATGGQVFGVATSQRATMNLESDGLRALNTTAFLGRFAPDPETGAPARECLGAGDLVVIDEASMSSTDHLVRITAIVAEAGARILPAGDHAQLQSVGAGGMFAVLAEKVAPGQRHELTEVHRFTHDWEKAASLRLRDGDASVFDEYAVRGRVRFGTLEEMQDGAARAYVTDRLAGRSSLLIVSTNPQAAAVSDTVRRELVALGRVGAEPVARLGDETELGLGDVVLALRNDYRARVDPAIGPDGRAGEARPVMNKELYTVIGAGPDRTLYVRDARGAVAHLPEAYVREHLTLGYAVTGHGAQGVTVDVGHNLVDRDATRESVYTGGGRGAGENLFWQVTDRAPDAHEPERLHEMSRERWADALERRAVEPAAIEVQAGYEATAESLASVAARVQIELAAAARARHEQVLDQLAADGVLDPAQLARLRSPAERSDRERLEHALRGAELAGHDVAHVLDRAIRDRELHTADSVGDVLKHRVVVVVVAAGRPGPYGTARSWADIVATHAEPAANAVGAALTDRTSRSEPVVEVGPDEAVAARPDPTSQQVEPDEPQRARGTYLVSAAALADQRQAAIGPRAAETEAPWAVALLGPVPDAEHAQERVEWERAASVIGGARELLAVGDQQVSLGEAPSPERALERHLWHAAMDEVTTAPETAGRDWRIADDAALYQAREQWARAYQHAPDWVGDELAAAHQLIRDYDGDAVRDAARARRDQHAHPERAADYARQADIAAGAAELARERAAELEAAHQARQAWWGEHGHHEHDARAAAAELARRGLPLERGVAEPAPELADPDRDLAATRNEQMIQPDVAEPEIVDPEVDAATGAVDVQPAVDEHQVDEHQPDVPVVVEREVELEPQESVQESMQESTSDWAQRLDERAAAAEVAAAQRRAQQREADRERLEAEAEQQQRAELETRQTEEREQQEQRALETASEPDLVESDLQPEHRPELQREVEPVLPAVVEREQPVVESEAEREARDRRFDAAEALEKARAARISVQQRQQQRYDDEAERHRSRMQHDHHRQHEREHDRGHEHGY